MKLSVLSLSLLLLGSARAATFYVDSAAGDDQHDGQSPAHAWQSIARVNRDAFAPGDRILLHAGSNWSDVTLQPRGSGTAGAPVVLGRYGEGPAPALHGRGRVPCVLRLDNQEYWEISHLELTNHSDTEGQRLRGVEIRATDSGVRHHLHFQHLVIHDVNAAATYTNDGDNLAKSFGGFVTLIEGSATPTSWDDFLVEDCRFTDIGPAGLTLFSSWSAGHRANNPATWSPSHNVVIRRCTFERIARNGLVVRACAAPLIEHNLFTHCGLLGSGNACFAFHCDDALFQFNEACYTKYNVGDADAAGFDSDYNCRRTVFQFNYSHDNDYGFILVCCAGPNGFNEDTIIRDNISQNDGGVAIRFAGPAKGTRVYRNTIYVGKNTGNPRESDPPFVLAYKTWNGWTDDTAFTDNIIVNLSERAGYNFAKSTGNRFEHNLFFGAHPASEPADGRKLTDDPQFANPGGASAHNESPDAGRISAWAAYRLQPGSSAVGLGAAALPAK